jgi:hypothetical protein
MDSTAAATPKKNEWVKFEVTAIATCAGMFSKPLGNQMVEDPSKGAMGVGTARPRTIALTAAGAA